MIESSMIRSIIEQYERFGWELRRVLLTPGLRAKIGTAVGELFKNVEIKGSDLDAAWFTRAAKNGGTAWELRALQESPFALIEVVGPDIMTDELDLTLAATEQQLRDRRHSASNGN
jgi:hypothetical protein